MIIKFNEILFFDEHSMNYNERVSVREDVPNHCSVQQNYYPAAAATATAHSKRQRYNSISKIRIAERANAKV